MLVCDPFVALMRFWSCLLPMHEYESVTWMSAAPSHILHLDQVVSKEARLSDGLVVSDLIHRRRVAVLCMFYKTRGNSDHALKETLPEVHAHARLTCQVVSVHIR